MMHDQNTGTSLPAGKRSVHWWAAAAVLVGAGMAPCPECGMPLAVHLWPLALLLAVARLVADRTRPRLPDPTAPEQPLDPDAEKTELP